MEFQKETNRIFAEDESGKVIAEVLFPEVREGVVSIDHTFVDDSLRGQGVAGELMETVYEILKEDGRKAELVCGYAVKWYGDNPDKNDIVAG